MRVIFTSSLLAFNLFLNVECSPQTVSSLSPSQAQNAADATLPAADGRLGSTLTLEQINHKPAAIIAQQKKVLSVRQVGESSPALKHRLWQPDFMLQAGSAQLHFFRAMLLWKEMPADFRLRVENWTLDDEPQPSPTERKEAMDQLQQVFAELHLLATAEDTKWDHRLRDLRGPAMYAYLLPDVQQSRSLARILDQRIQLQIFQNDVDGAIESLRDGFRLAAFVGQGETLVQQLVGTAIAAIMLEKLEHVMQMPDSPNLYWPIATLPRPFVDINNSIQFELSAIHRVLPILAEAETENRTEEYWIGQWAKMLTAFETLGGNDHNSKIALAIIGVASAGAAKERLIASGRDRSEVEAMPALRAVLLETSLSIRRMSDQLAKANYLPASLGKAVSEQANQDFNRWVKENQLQSGASAIMGLLFPAVEAAKSAGVRQEYVINRLMTIEALRMHASSHAGNLPTTLGELDPVPALPNPFNGQPFHYQVDQDGDVRVVTLSADVPRSVEFMQEIKIRFLK